MSTFALFSGAAAAALLNRTPGLCEISTTTSTPCVISIHINSDDNKSPTHDLELMESCRGTDDVVSYSDCDCDCYCIAQSQPDTVGGLADCLAKGSSCSGISAKGGIVQVWCNNVIADADVSDTPGGSITISASETSAEPPASTTPSEKGEELEDEPTETKGELETILNGGEAQGNSVTVTTAILLALMAFGGAVRPAP
ncbi:hypothetical protein BJX66DRAFT_312725 [Aspergillus keveii]|uniref:GPI anchored protein n=1 Tax=Aspergillus keveii TaxID=714993 RepID=A0ABR4FT55_9EURO